ncbi:MAG: hypothetical protein N2039_12795 [Gemmataceae bacterium]|nr:hypothetical protein [Gemmataceae bacterium]
MLPAEVKAGQGGSADAQGYAIRGSNFRRPMRRGRSFDGPGPSEPGGGESSAVGVKAAN